MKESLQFLKTTILCYLLTLATLPLTAVMFIALFIYKQIVFVLLNKRSNPSDIIRLNSSDAMWTTEGCRESAIDVVAIVNLKSGEFDDLIGEAKQSFENRILKNSSICPKLTSTLETFMGYAYLKRANISVSDCVSVLDTQEFDKQNQKSVLEIFSEHTKKPMPLNNRLLYELVFINGTDEWKKKQSLNKSQVPFLFRVSHIVGDGLALANYFTNLFADNKTDINESLKKFSKMFTKEKNSIFIRMLTQLHFILLTPGFIFLHFIRLFRRNHNIWNSPDVIHKRRLYWAIESNAGMIDNIKFIKNRIGNTSFTDVILTTISASLGTYFEKMPGTPEYTIMSLIIAGASLSQLNDFDGNPDIKNQFSMVFLKLPLCLKSNNLCERLDIIKSEMRKLNRASEVGVNHILLNKILGIFPLPLIKVILYYNKLATCLSNLPGIPKMKLWKGQEIENAVFFPPSKNQMGANFSVFTYNNQLHLGFSADEATIPSDEACENIMNRLFDNITLLKNEVLDKKI